MKPKTNPPTSAPAPAAPPPPSPEFDRLAAVPVAPARHAATARTVGHVQPAGKSAHLFSATGDYIATVPTAEAAPFLPTPPAAPAAA